MKYNFISKIPFHVIWWCFFSVSPLTNNLLEILVQLFRRDYAKIIWCRKTGQQINSKAENKRMKNTNARTKTGSTKWANIHLNVRHNCHSLCRVACIHMFPLYKYHFVAGNCVHFEAVWGLFSFAGLSLHFIVISTKGILKCKNFFHSIFFLFLLQLYSRIAQTHSFNSFFFSPISSRIISSLVLVHVATFLMEKRAEKNGKANENNDREKEREYWNGQEKHEKATRAHGIIQESNSI